MNDPVTHLNNRAVINGTTGAVEQTVAYYPFGGVIADLGTPAGGQPYKFGGKELLTANGLNEYDFGVRLYYPAVPHFTSIDPLCEDYYPLSPYLYCANNPVNAIDLYGRDIFILNFGYDLTHQHLAMLIQDENNKWQYYSVNGDNVYISGVHEGGRKFYDVGVGSWESPEDFLNSDYNVRDEESKEDINKNNFGFKEGYLIETSGEQDKIMSSSFAEISESDYSLFGNNCAIAVQKSMFDAGIPVAEPDYIITKVPANKKLGEESFVIKRPNFNPIPSIAFKNIMKQKPNRRVIKKSK